MYQIKRKDEEIDNLLNTAVEWEMHGGSSVRGMTFEQGVQAGIRWVTGDTEDYPIEEEPPQ